jgi:hypothetical protein
MSTETTGTGDITLDAAVPSFLTFAEAGAQDGDIITYAIEANAEREVGRVTYRSAGPTLEGRTVLRSTNNNQLINLTGHAEIAISAAAEDFNELKGMVPLAGGQMSGPLEIHTFNYQLLLGYPAVRWWAVVVGGDGGFDIIDFSANAARLTIDGDGHIYASGLLTVGGLNTGGTINAGGFVTPGNGYFNVVSCNGFTSNNGNVATGTLNANGTIRSEGEVQSGGAMEVGSVGARFVLGGPHHWSFHYNGNCYCNVDGAIGWQMINNSGCDERLKQDIAPSTFNCLAVIEKIPLFQFRWMDQTTPGKPKPVEQRPDNLIPVGVIAQRLQEIQSWLVTTPIEPPETPPGEEGTFSALQLDQANMIATLIGAVQELADAMRAARLLPRKAP